MISEKFIKDKKTGIIWRVSRLNYLNIDEKGDKIHAIRVDANVSEHRYISIESLGDCYELIGDNSEIKVDDVRREIEKIKYMSG